MTHPFAEQGPVAPLTVGRVEDWADGQARDIKIHKKPMTVVRQGERFFAINSICPHMGGPMSCGKVEDGCITCPWHEWKFDLETGISPNGHRLDRYEVTVENGEVKIGWVMTD